LSTSAADGLIIFEERSRPFPSSSRSAASANAVRRSGGSSADAVRARKAVARAEAAEERVRYLEQKLDTANELLELIKKTVMIPAGLASRSNK
jgi:hypothetical protein